MPVDAQISVAGTTAVPVSYTVPNAVEVTLLCVNATIDGTGAASAFLATIEIVSDGGVVVARCPCFTQIAAGGTAEISWFRIRGEFDSAPVFTPYEALILSNPNLRAYYKLDEPSGTTMLDSGPLTLNGTYLNTPTLAQPPLADGLSVAWDDPTKTAGQVTGVNGIVNTGEMSVVAWIKTTQADGHPALVVNADDNNKRYFQFRISTTRKVEMINFDAVIPPAVYDILGATTVNDGVKHMIAGTLDTAGTQTLYVDGVQDAQIIAALPSLSVRVEEVDVASRVILGVPGNGYTGTLDEVAIYNWSLTAAEIAAIHAAG